jgi:hypothetical protein
MAGAAVEMQARQLQEDMLSTFQCCCYSLFCTCCSIPLLIASAQLHAIYATGQQAKACHLVAGQLQDAPTGSS